ncbi:MAG: hypothetical protein A2015_13665 [Spirochaetes bacterium GWF1_31_7]|nr:MAG: hypothetical protein A2Y30_11160 [Spirochaetes bacterium GWE1_32_154]OHD47714.1 MAG: hypothetical protein A2Y29_05130 [Spirochaetes bacterium GWE2_31_10]OHD49867.1 MAG: hypothetical protein A2015_13665 [Spirochaetes bacterium GWF1_31_7]OHD82155.1 MAG: hypothetical protein A2355_13745 [Spirochaetes bacterium RIFOXYB1_FULL_32_8]HBD92884.1 hypothetical protein [Spirochaetia bacterium]
MKIFKRFLLLIIVSLFSVSCADPESEIGEVSILSVKPVGTHDIQPLETSDQLNVEVVAVLDKLTDSALTTSTWIIEKIKYDIDDESLKTESIISSEDSETAYFLETSKDGLTAFISFYHHGSYRVTYSVTDYQVVKNYSIIIKNGEPEFPHLFLSLNLYENEKNKILEYRGAINLEVSGESGVNIINDLTVDRVGSSWYDTDISLNPLKSFTIQSGIPVVYDDNTNDIQLLSIDQILKISDESGELTEIKSQIDVTGNKLTIDLIDKKSFILSDVYTVLHYWIKGEKDDEYKFLTKTIKGDEYPVFEEIEDDGVHSAKLFIGNIGVFYSNTRTFTYFSVEGLRNSFVDIKNIRPFPSLPFGYLVGKLGDSGIPFPIGASYEFIEKTSEPVYYYDGEEFVLNK